MEKRQLFQPTQENPVSGKYTIYIVSVRGGRANPLPLDQRAVPAPKKNIIRRGQARPSGKGKERELSKKDRGPSSDDGVIRPAAVQQGMTSKQTPAGIVGRFGQRKRPLALSGPADQVAHRGGGLQEVFLLGNEKKSSAKQPGGRRSDGLENNASLICTRELESVRGGTNVLGNSKLLQKRNL